MAGSGITLNTRVGLSYKVMSAPETQNQNSRTIKPNAKKPSGCGCIVFFIILLAVLGGLFYLWQSKQLNQDFLSTLKLPQLGDFTNKDQNNGVNLSSSGGFSQTEPIQMASPNNTSTNSKDPTNASYKNGKQSNVTSQESLNQANNPLVRSNNKVPSGYPFVEPNIQPVVRPITNNSSANISKENISREIANEKISYKNFLPQKVIEEGSLESYIQTKNPQENSLAVRPKQIILFKSTFYTLNEAFMEFTNKLKKLGFTTISVPINDYKKGGATVIESKDQYGKQIYISFKPMNEMTKTAWRIEIY